jgi:Xaa-Pro aminopeptidase
MNERIAKVRRVMAEVGVQAILVTDPFNRRYLTGFRPTHDEMGLPTAHALIMEARVCLLTNPLHSEQAKGECPEAEVLMYESAQYDLVAATLQESGVERLGFEAGVLSVRDFQTLQKSAGGEIELVDVGERLSTLRIIKDQDELAKIRRAVELADDAFDYVAARLVAGVTEADIAWVLEKHMRDHGAEAAAFDIIVASGPNGALPHAIPGDRAIEEGEPIVIDMGARFEGYNSDLTRTLCVGTPDSQFQKIYDIVLKANLAAEASIRAGQTGMEADAFARNIIDEAGYGAEFYHSLGHGVGLAVHESPTLRKRSEAVLEENMVVTIEPGIYIPGWGGVRIEDTVIIKQDGVEVLTKAPKEVLPV